MTVSHLDHLKSDVAGWIAAAAEHRDVIEPKPGTRMVLGPLDSPNTREPPPLQPEDGPGGFGKGKEGGAPSCLTDGARLVLCPQLRRSGTQRGKG